MTPGGFSVNQDFLHADFAVRPLTSQDEPFLWDMLYHAIFVAEGQPRPPRILEEPALAHYVAGWGNVQEIPVVLL